MVWPFSPRFRKSIARIEVTGVIAAATRKRVLEALKEIEEKRFPALLLRIDSPGGTVGDSQEIYTALQLRIDSPFVTDGATTEIYTALQRLKDKLKIVASFGNISASGGVYIGMGADHIMANPGTITGSIGVILRGNNLERLLDRVGVSFKVIKSGPYKDILAFDRELTDPEKSILQELIDVSYGQFVKTVAEARRLSEDTVRSFADGRIFTGEQALQLGVVDRLGSEDEARRWAAELVGLDPDKAECITFDEKKPLLKRLVPGNSSIVLTGSSSLPYPQLAVPALNATLEWLEFERSTSGLPLWLYRP